MAFLRLRGGKYSLTLKWKGKTHIKALGTDNHVCRERAAFPPGMRVTLTGFVYIN